MIKIADNRKFESGEKVYNYYLYLLAWILPFAPEDILNGDEIEIGGQKITGDNFLSISGKKPRRRNRAYIKLLEDYLNKENLAEDMAERFQEDRLLAARLIENADTDLFSYLYDSRSGSVPKLRKGKLRNLLFAKMDCFDEELNRLPIIEQKASSDLLLEHVFRYREFAASRYAMSIIEDLNVQVCPYCNCQYTTTVSSKKKKIRPQLDHYKCKSKYPFFAVTLRNLIPSCPICNQRKTDKTEEVLYPYSDEMGTDFVFRTRASRGVRYLIGDEDAGEEFDLKLIQSTPFISDKLIRKEKNSKEILGLEDIYKAHKDYVLLLFRKHYVYNEAYLEEIQTIFEKLFSDNREMKKLFYVLDIDPHKWGERPLSKLTHDIDQEIKELKYYADMELSHTVFGSRVLEGGSLRLRYYADRE